MWSWGWGWGLLVGCSPAGAPPVDDTATAAETDTVDASDSGVVVEALCSDVAPVDYPDALDPSVAEVLQDALDSVGAEAAHGMVAALVVDEGVFVGATGSDAIGTPLDPASVFRVGSVTKLFTAALVMRGAQEGRADPGDLVVDWVDGDLAARLPPGLTLTHLMRHTSGLPDFVEDEAFVADFLSDASLEFTPEMLVDIAMALPLAGAAGEGHHYSNTNYMVLGRVLEGMTGVDYATNLRACATSGLPSMAFAGEEPVPELVVGSFDGQVGTDLMHPSLAWTAGGMVASAGDLAVASHRLLRGEGALEQEALDAMFASTSQSPDYGLGTQLWGSTLVGHNGATLGYKAHLRHDLATGDTAVLLVPRYEASGYDLMEAWLAEAASSL